MAATNVHPDDDDYGDLDIRKKPSSSHATLFIILACGIIFVVLLTCVVGVAFVGMMERKNRGGFPQQVAKVKEPEVAVDPEAVKFLGAWKGRFVLNGQQRDHRYTFRKDGTLREDEFDQQGGVIRASEARWRFRNGQIEINWQAGGVEIATARWLDKDSFEYHIIQHTDGAQIGMKETFRRQ